MEPPLFFDRYTVVFSLASSPLPDWTGRQNRPIVFSTPHPAAAVVHRQTPPGIPGIPMPGSYHPRPCPRPSPPASPLTPAEISMPGSYHPLPPAIPFRVSPPVSFRALCAPLNREFLRAPDIFRSCGSPPRLQRRKPPQSAQPVVFIRGLRCREGSPLPCNSLYCALPESVFQRPNFLLEFRIGLLYIVPRQRSPSVRKPTVDR